MTADRARLPEDENRDVLAMARLYADEKLTDRGVMARAFLDQADALDEAEKALREIEGGKTHSRPDLIACEALARMGEGA